MLGKDFYAGGERRLLVDQILELALESNMMAVVSGPEGSGKSALADELCRCFGDDAVCITIAATLFMTEDQFLDAIGRQLPKHKHISATPTVAAGIARLRQLAAELDLEAQSLVLIVDDANELSADVLAMLDDIVQGGSSKSSIRAILLGEKQLINLLHTTLPEASQANLAHFELAGFDAEDTLEYIGFKLANAGMDSPVPLTEERIAEIQQAANGMPGAINALVADSLENGDTASAMAMDPELDSAAAEQESDPEEDQFSFDAQDHMQFDLDMVDLDTTDEPEFEEYEEYEEPAELDAEGARIVPAQLYDYASQYRYQIGASLLAVVLLVTMFVWNSETTPATASVVTQPLATTTTVRTDPTASGSVNRIQLTPPVAAAVSAAEPTQPQSASLTAASLSSGAEAQATSVTEVVEDIGTEPAPVTKMPDTAAVATVVAPTGGSEASAETTKKPEVVAPAPAPAKPAVAAVSKPAPELSGLSGFEQELLSYAANSFTIQILGSHSEANVQKFVAGKSVSEKHGYYETRHQNKPWFVVVAGNYSDRAAANAVIARLPAELRNMQPWIRTVGDIQRDIRQLHN